MKVLVIDYGMGNLGSVRRALEECGASNVTISNSDADFHDCTHAILPGVGAFPDAMKNLKKKNLPEKIQQLAVIDKIPLLGICLGMQLLADSSIENEFTEGLHLIPGSVVQFSPSGGERIPHIGWNEVHHDHKHEILKNIPSGADFYFVHSYHLNTTNADHTIGQTPYCGGFASVVALKNIVGTQFHPEKSSTVGFALLKNFLEMNNA